MSLYAAYVNGEPFASRPLLAPPERDDFQIEWLQNVTVVELFYWGVRNEMLAHIFRKGASRSFYDTSVVLLGEPRGTERWTVEQLIERDIIGVYGWRRCEGMCGKAN